MNATPTFPYLEEYIEFIAGYRSVDGKTYSLFEQLPVPINLARYDEEFIQSVSEQTNNQLGFYFPASKKTLAYTDKQAELAYKIVDKYRRQLSKLKPSVIVPENVKDLPLKHGLRNIDRNKTVTLEDDWIIVKFPFDKSFIYQLKTQAKEGHGTVTFDPEKKRWKLAKTEYMLNWIMAVCSSTFFIDDEIKTMYQKLQEVEKNPFKIELDIVNNTPVISNIPHSMLEYINTHLGGLTLENLIILVDNSPVLGYTISDIVKEVISIQYPECMDLLFTRRAFVDKSQLSIDGIIKYATLTNRLPVYMYDNGLSKIKTDNIVYLSRATKHVVHPKLLVSTSNMMIGSRKESWVLNSEKFIIIT